jgi:uridine phosphorylase
MQNPILEFATNSIKEVRETLFVLPTMSAVRAFRKSLPENYEFKQSQLVADAIALYNLDSISVIGPTLGAPAAQLACEPLIRKGVKRVILLGIAGALPSKPENLKVGDILTPRGFISDASSQGSPDPDDIEIAKPSSLQSEIEQTLSSHFEAVIWSTNNPYLQNESIVKKYYDAGATAVDMEGAVVHKLCEIYEIEFAAAYVISDVWSLEWSNQIGSKFVNGELEKLIETILPVFSLTEVN